MEKNPSPDVVIIGGGPVGLWTAIRMMKDRSDLRVQVYERHQEYQRSHVLKLKHVSLLLYKKPTNDPDEAAFHREVTGGKSLSEVYAAAAAGLSVFVRTNVLENALKKYAQALGVNITYAKIETPEEAERLHPDCKLFVAADGAHSKMRETLFGKDAIRHFVLQYIAEIKYQAKGKAGKLSFLEAYKTNKLLSGPAFEYVGREKDGTTPVSLRFFMDRETYDAIPTASFKEPLKLDDPRLPPQLTADFRTMMNARAIKAGEVYDENSAKLSKLTLTHYASRSFATLQQNGKAWFVVGDAAMGVPYFRSLNAGFVIGNQLGYFLKNSRFSTENKVRAYNFVRPFDIAWEFTEARIKNMGLMLYQKFCKASARSPLSMVNWDAPTAQEMKSREHPAFKPKM